MKIFLNILILLFFKFSSSYHYTIQFGFYAMDEHFQILEPLAFKLNLRNNVNADIWEFGATMRPWSQIYLSLLLLNFFKYFQ